MSPTRSPRIYRYYEARHAVSTIRDLEIRTSLPDRLNDPFELAPKIDVAQFTREQCERILMQPHHVEEAYQREAAVRGLFDKESFHRWYRSTVSERAASHMRNIPHNVEQVRQNFAQMFAKHWRLICGSEVFDSILMWSHYARDHTGIVLGFDTARAPFCEVPDDCWLNINYSGKKADYSYDPDEQIFREKMFSVAATKATEWAYESEVRIIVPTNLVLRDRFLPISPESIAAVYFGCRTSEDDKKAAAQVLKERQLALVEQYHGALDPNEYRLNFEKNLSA